MIIGNVHRILKCLFLYENERVRAQAHLLYVMRIQMRNLTNPSVPSKYQHPIYCFSKHYYRELITAY